MSTSKTHKSNYDPIDSMIFVEGLRIQRLFFDRDLDLMLVVLNNKKVLKESISKYKLLSNATMDQLQDYEVSRTGVHWPELDEDLSLRGFLKVAMLSSVHQESKLA